MLLLRVLAAFWAAENTEEKNPPPPDVAAMFSVAGVRGADVLFESLLGPIVTDPDRTRLCDIIFPVGDKTTLRFEVMGSDDVRW
jgi:hypothetical protein